MSITHTKALTAAICILSLACQHSPKSGKVQDSTAVSSTKLVEASAVPFEVAKNYFVKNTVSQVGNPKIETAEQFEEIFGMATTMGPQGQPTRLDFAKQYVIAVVLPETNLQTSLEAVSLVKDADGGLTFTFKKTVGGKQSYTMVPNLAIVVSKANSGKVTLQSVE